MSSQRKRLHGERGDAEDAHGIGEWERAYVDERSWEELQDYEFGLLRPIDNNVVYHTQYRCHLCMLSDVAAAAEMDSTPSRIAIMAKHDEAFIREFFDQNPLSQIGLVSIKE